MKLERNNTSAAQEYWDRIERTARKAEAWPAWKKTDWGETERKAEPKDQATRRSTKQT
jgi:hypothetical protein